MSIVCFLEVKTMLNDNRELPLLPLRGLLIFPSMVLHLDVGRDKSVAALEKAMMGDQIIFLVAQKKVSLNETTTEDIYVFYMLSYVIQMIKILNGTHRVFVERIKRCEIIQY